MNAAEQTASELAEIRVKLARVSEQQPAAVMMALIEQLIDAVCGDPDGLNPALRGMRRLWFYRGLLAKVGG
jgi:hypothetical protein